MKLHTIKQEDWQPYFDRISKVVLGQGVELEISAEEIGDQIGGEWAAVEGLSYDAHADTLYVHASTNEHAIKSPKEIVAVEDEGALKSIAIKDANGWVQTLHFRDPLRLNPVLKTDEMH